MSEMAQALAAPLFLESGGFSSRLTIINELNFATPAQVILRELDGRQICVENVELPAHSRLELEVAEILEHAGSASPAGSVEVLPDPSIVVTMAVAAQLSITGSGINAGQHLEEEFTSAAAGSVGEMGALRAAGGPYQGTPVVAIQNLTGSRQSATATCVSDQGATRDLRVVIQAHAVGLVEPCAAHTDPGQFDLADALAADPGAPRHGPFGVTVSGENGPPAIAAFGFSWRGTSGGPAMSSQNFIDSGLLRSGNIVFTGVPIGSIPGASGAVFTPELSLTNSGPVARKANVLFARTDPSGVNTSEVASIDIEPRTSVTVPLPALPGEPDLRDSFLIRSDGAPGDMAAELASVASPGATIVEQIGKDQETLENGGAHPWNISNGQEAILLLFNHSASAKYFNVKIGNGAVLWQDAWQLMPMETRAIRIRDLIDGQVADHLGERLPRSLSSGELSWFTPNPSEGKGRLLEIDPVSGDIASNRTLARSFSCGYNFVICGAYLETGAITFPYGAASSPSYLGAVVPDICLAFDPTACSGQSYGQGGSGYTYNWYSNAPSIANVYGSASAPTAEFWGSAVGAGSATGQVQSQYCSKSGGGELTVTPTVNIQVAPGFVSMAGNGLVVMGASGLTSTAVSAKGNPSGGTVSWTAGPRLRISGTNSVNATVAGTAPSTSAGDTYASVAYSLSGQAASASQRFTVLNPTILKAASFPGGSKYTTSYQNGSLKGYYTSITYYVYDQMSPANIIALPGLAFTEVLTTLSNPYGADFTPADGNPRTVSSDASGAMMDALYAYATLPGLPTGFTASRSQSLSANGYPFSPAQQQSYTATGASIATQELHR